MDGVKLFSFDALRVASEDGTEYCWIPMKTHYHFKGMTSSPAMEERAKKIEDKLRQFYPQELEITWHFEAEKHFNEARVHVVGPHIDFNAHTRDEDMYHAIDQTMERLIRQVKEDREKVSSHH